MANPPWAELSTVSSGQMNNMTIMGRTGAQIAALSPTYAGQIVYCNSTGSGFTVDHWYGRNVTNDAWIDQTAIDMYNVWKNTQTTIEMDKRHSPMEGWYRFNAGTASAVTNNLVDTTTACIDLTTGTTINAGGVAGITIGGPQIDFSKKAIFKCVVRTPTTAVTGQIVKIGCNVEKAGVANTTNAQFGIEYCDGNANWQIHTGSGSAQSNMDTLIPVTASAMLGFTVEFNPGVNVICYFDDGTIKTKVSDIPSTGNNTEDKLFRISICNNNGSTTSRTFQVCSAYMIYKTNDMDWLQQPV
jgi:hypothetical protein